MDPTAASFGRVLIGIEGLARLWGDETALLRRALALVGPWLPGRPRTGIGNTRFGAAVAARVGAGAIPIGGWREEAAFLAPLPLALLPATAETQERLRVLGLRWMGELAALDRSAVIARFGTEGAGLHDLVRGLDRRPLRPRRPVERLSAEAELEPAAETSGAAALRAPPTLRHALRAALGARCRRSPGHAHAVAGPTSPPSQARPSCATSRRCRSRRRRAGLLERLLMARLEAEPPGAPVERLGLELEGAAPEAGQQLALFERQLAHAARLGWQLASLAIRFGEDRILRASSGDPEALLAEQRFRWHAAAGEP